jgi:uncharacterized protein YtpQ (UPF0354 family)
MSTNQFLLTAIPSIRANHPKQAIDPEEALSLPNDQQPVVTDIGHGLYAVYLMDDGENLRYVQRYQLDSLNGQAKGLHEIGLLNLAKLSQEKLRIFPYGAVHGLLLNGQFEASLILLDNLWDGSLAQYTPNGPIVALPSRDVLAFCDAKSLQGIVELKQLVERSLENDHQLTNMLYYRQDGQWLPLD